MIKTCLALILHVSVYIFILKKSYFVHNGNKSNNKLGANNWTEKTCIEDLMCVQLSLFSVNQCLQRSVQRVEATLSTVSLVVTSSEWRFCCRAKTGGGG